MSVATSPDELLEGVGVARRHVAELDRHLEQHVADTVDAIVTRLDAGEQVFPEVDFADVAAGTVAEPDLGQIAERGCVVVRGTFDVAQAAAWDADLADYLARNQFEQRLLDKYPELSAAAKIWPIYWSRPQVEARQHDNMAIVRRFLNGFWRHTDGGHTWFDPDLDIGYADRIRRRQPGVEAAALRPHNDAPSALGWRLPENQRVFAPLLRAGLEGFDAWDAAGRTDVDPASRVVASVFRTFQGWTALSEMDPSDGVLHVIPILPAAGQRLVHHLAVELGLSGEPSPAPRRDFGGEVLARAQVPIPAVAPGDTVWWHGDLFHSVGAAANRERWGNVMYIGAAPSCPRNDEYQPSLYPRFAEGVSPLDFPDDRFESEFLGRANIADLNRRGRAQFGID
jgi:hypothetical protein